VGGAQNFRFFVAKYGLLASIRAYHGGSIQQMRNGSAPVLG
jgi:hypothetical protein